MEIALRAKAILAAEASAIASVSLDQSFVDAITALEVRSGRIVTTGMGKAGHVAHKFAAILSSTGSPALFIHPGEAAHGDLGGLAPGDCVIALSTSGKTREVLEMIDFARQLACGTVIGITSHPQSPLREASDIVLSMGEITEPCPLGLTPTASIAVMSAITDAIALVLMECRGTTREEYGLRHHGGYLGRKARTDEG